MANRAFSPPAVRDRARAVRDLARAGRDLARAGRDLARAGRDLARAGRDLKTRLSAVREALCELLREAVRFERA